MDFMKIRHILESDIDSVIINAGGERYVVAEAPDKVLNVDYQIEDTIIELKFLENEGMQEKDRQRKIANLFKAHQNRHAVILDPKKLDSFQRKTYYRTLERPIKNHVRKSDKQLQKSALNNSDIKCKILFIVNNG